MPTVNSLGALQSDIECSNSDVRHTKRSVWFHLCSPPLSFGKTFRHSTFGHWWVDDLKSGAGLCDLERSDVGWQSADFSDISDLKITRLCRHHVTIADREYRYHRSPDDTWSSDVNSVQQMIEGTVSKGERQTRKVCDGQVWRKSQTRNNHFRPQGSDQRFHW